MDFIQQLKDWDGLIRSGKASKVRSLAHKLNHKKIPRELIVDYAHIARRVGAPELIVLWLVPIVRAEKILALPATAKEKAIYGLGLLRLGAFREAEQILNEIDPEVDPQVFFYRASLNINQWNYAKAIPDLRKYIQHREVLPYSRTVGKLNLCAALVAYKDDSKAERTLTQLMKELRREGSALLIGNLLEIRAQWFYNQRRFEEALHDLNEASSLLQHADAKSLLYINKWRAIIELHTAKRKEPALAKLEQIRQKAIETKSWETVRDCDLHRALITKDESLILKVYWGSKSTAYKQRIREHYPSLRVSDRFIWNSSAEAKGVIVNLLEEAPTRSLQNLFFILSQEMYQPLRSTEIIDTLYPEEYYNPATSPAKLHRLIARARQWLLANGYPITIKSFRNAFQIEFASECQLQLTSKLQPFEKTHWPRVTEQEFFRAEEWATELELPARTARQQISLLVTQGKLEKIGHGSRTKYRIRKKAA